MFTRTLSLSSFLLFMCVCMCVNGCVLQRLKPKLLLVVDARTDFAFANSLR